MPTSTLVDRVRVLSNTVGTATTIALGSAVSGYVGTEALTDGATYSYLIEQGSDFEYGRGVYTASGHTFTRGVIKSTLSDDPISIGSGTFISFVLLVEDLDERVGIPANLTVGTVTAVPSGTPPSFTITPNPTSPDFIVDVELETGTPGSAAAETIIVANNMASVITVAGISTNVTTVAGISAAVTTVAGVAPSVTIVAGGITNINLVGNDLALGSSSLILQAMPAAIQTSADRTQTGLDRTQTALDRIATAADRVQTGLDAAAASAFINGKLYATTAAGVTGTGGGSPVAGSDFFLLAVSGAASLPLYRNVAGVAIDQAFAIPGTGSLSALSLRLTSAAPMGFAGGFANAPGQYPILFAYDGTVRMSRARVTYLTVDTALTAGGASIASGAAIGFVASLARDIYGRTTVGVKASGALAARRIEAVTLNDKSVRDIIFAVTPKAIFDAEINGIIIYGQSLSVGAYGTPIITTTQKYDSLKFFGGVRPFDSNASLVTAAPDARTSLLPLVEAVSPADPTYGETGAGKFAEYLKERILADYGISYTQQSYQLLLSSSGHGGAALDGLDPGSAQYDNVTADIDGGYACAQALGKTYKVRQMSMVQGQGDYAGSEPTDAGVTTLVKGTAGSGGTNGTFAIGFSGGGGSGAAGTFTVAGGSLVSLAVTTNGVNYTSSPTVSLAASSGLTGATATALVGTPRSIYRTLLLSILSTTDTHAKAVTGQASSVIMSLAQVYGHQAYGHPGDPYIALEQASIAAQVANFYISAPEYAFPRANGVHLSALGYSWLHSYNARVYKRVIIEKGTWSPLQPVSAERQGVIVLVRYAPESGQLYWNTSRVTLQTNYGFTLVDSLGNDIAISSVSIINNDTVKIVAGTTVPAGAKVRYGFGLASSTSLAVGGGNLFDTMGNYVTPTVIAGLSYRMDNAALISENTLA